MRWRFSGDIDTRITEREREKESDERSAYLQGRSYKEDPKKRFLILTTTARIL
jgi:hypothetical protein